MVNNTLSTTIKKTLVHVKKQDILSMRFGSELSGIQLPLMVVDFGISRPILLPANTLSGGTNRSSEECTYV